MQPKHPSVRLSLVLAIVASTMLFAVTPATAQVEGLLFSFENKVADGNFPIAGVIFDASGNLYGATQGGNGCSEGGCGTVFELTLNPGGGWTHEELYRFSGGDGEGPVASLIFDTSGNLYGTTWTGGSYACGVVFKLSPKVGGGWTESVLHHFNNNGIDGCRLNNNGIDGCRPESSLILDASGNLYGTTTFGGNQSCYTFQPGCGTVFELLPQQDGTWNEKILHYFSNQRKDGYWPYTSSLAVDAVGNLYGTTTYGGSHNSGTAYELTPRAHGRWAERVLHSFRQIRDAALPEGGVTIDAAGNLYGMTYFGGSYGYGTVFEVSPKADRGWTEKILHSFNGNGTDGFEPQGCTLTLDGAGSLYGTTTTGGANLEGTVFKLTPTNGGIWTEKVLVTFDDPGGSFPYSGMVFDSLGNLYGTTSSGGANGSGTVFEITP